MDITKQNPFSLYDFLGYFVPGAFVVYILYFIRDYIDWSTPLFEVGVKNISFEKPEVYLPFIIFSYVLGHLLSFISSITIEQYSIWRFGYPSKFLLGIANPGYLSANQDKKPLHIIIRIMMGLFLLPITLFDYIFGQLFGMRVFYTKPLDMLLVDVINRKVRDILKSRAGISEPRLLEPPIEHDFFRYVDHYVLENAPNHVPKMQNYVALYGFLRTITLTFVIYFWIVSLQVFGALSGIFQIFCINKLTTPSCFALLGILASLSYVLFMGFMKFYRRYSLESLMAATVVYQG